jgi:ADP-dependent NAD(P)H-hydrate dehydratase / NAD(P)H-hydrate epimerase
MTTKSRADGPASMEGIPNSCAVLSVAETYAADQAAASAGIASLDLMEAAGAGVAALIRGKWAPRPVVVLCGPGNNGGDGFVVARLLVASGWDVRVALYGDAGSIKGDAAVNKERWRSLGREIIPLDSCILADRPLIVDAMFGAGLNRPLDGKLRQVIDHINQDAMTCVAVDIPSGVNGDSGQVLGDGAGAPRCMDTATFFRQNPGHTLYPGREYCGKLTVVDIGIPELVLGAIAPKFAINVPELWSVPKPSWTDHKYSRGHAIVVGGGDVTGAARLAARAARRVGAGLVTLAVPSNAIPIYASSEPGAFVVALDTGADLVSVLSDHRRNGVLIGPGAGVGSDTAVRVLQILGTDKAAVLDADALTSFEDDPEQLFSAVRRRAAPVILTPHSGEFDRLFGGDGDKLARAINAADVSGAVVVFKGADTVVADPNGRAAIATNAPPWLATGGAGDVLAGIALGLLVQGMPTWQAAAAAVWLHGAAGALVGRGLIAEDIPDALPDILKTL